MTYALSEAFLLLLLAIFLENSNVALLVAIETATVPNQALQKSLTWMTVVIVHVVRLPI